jgi:tyrosinase
MKTFFASLIGITTLTSLLASVQAASNFTDGPSCGVPKADDSYFSVVGVQGTGVHPRQELRELAKDTELWNMFLQAFGRFQAMDQNEKISFYQIAGQSSVIYNRFFFTDIWQGYMACPSSSGTTQLDRQATR